MAFTGTFYTLDLYGIHEIPNYNKMNSIARNLVQFILFSTQHSHTGSTDGTNIFADSLASDYNSLLKVTAGAMRASGDGNIGIGVIDPLYRLHIKEGNIALQLGGESVRKMIFGAEIHPDTGDPGLFLTNDPESSATGPIFELRSAMLDGDATMMFTTGGSAGNAKWMLYHNGSSEDLTFKNSSSVDVLKLKQTGDVGIGLDPTEKLEVGGKIKTNNQVVSTLATGTSPLVIASTTLVSNLNVAQVGGVSEPDIESQARISNTEFRVEVRNGTDPPGAANGRIWFRVDL